ncbi:uncharacterized protein PAC_01657 [Phialocephala subalpina]|uniref:Uncharacterized protein n=1 Tax=Phialocephala subalpina TaxID=576137 RepID=A0A1L7WG84_9HELO|nr:uncharacterized protein PAC_01657 [Phialocephala subalpina]
MVDSSVYQQTRVGIAIDAKALKKMHDEKQSLLRLVEAKVKKRINGNRLIFPWEMDNTIKESLPAAERMIVLAAEKRYANESVDVLLCPQAAIPSVPMPPMTRHQVRFNAMMDLRPDDFMRILEVIMTRKSKAGGGFIPAHGWSADIGLLMYAIIAYSEDAYASLVGKDQVLLQNLER